MATKYKLLNTPEEFDAKEAEMKTLLAIPDNAGTSKYAESVMIDNPDHADYGMFLFPVISEGKWKCDQHFNASELVDHDSSWAKPQEEPV
jgi:hypothetical protein